MKTKSEAQILIPIIGDPVAQAATPDIWNEQFKQEHKDMACIPVHLHPNGLTAFMEMVRHADNIPGFISTIPHKAMIPALCDICSFEVELLGVANSIRKNKDGKFECAMFDGKGMISAIVAKGGIVAGGSLLIIGCGAAGSAIAFEALGVGALKIVVMDKNIALAERISGQLKTAFPDRDIRTSEREHKNYSVIVNASPQGSQSTDDAPYPIDGLPMETIIADAITEPRPTAWLAQADKRGMTTVDGQEMAAAQSRLMQEFLGIG